MAAGGGARASHACTAPPPCAPVAFSLSPSRHRRISPHAPATDTVGDARARCSPHLTLRRLHDRSLGCLVGWLVMVVVAGGGYTDRETHRPTDRSIDAEIISRGEGKGDRTGERNMRAVRAWGGSRSVFRSYTVPFRERLLFSSRSLSCALGGHMERSHGGSRWILTVTR